jgi:prenyltransferase beta subunit
MRFQKIMSITALVCALIFSTAEFSSSAEKKEPPKKIDLSLTLQFIQTWSSRDKWDKFPESPSFAYYNTYALKALNAEISPELRNKIITALKNCQMKDGGFSAGPNYSKESNSIYTYFSLATLDLLNALDSIDRANAAEYIGSLTLKDGSIKAKTADARATLATTYYGVASLGILKALDTLDKKSVIAYINTYREDHKGYGLLQGKISLPGATFMAIRSLSLLGGVTPDIRKEVGAYLAETRYSGQIKDRKYTTLPSMEEMADVLEALSDLSSLNLVGKDAVYQFIESLYIPQNGGFGPEPGLGTTPPSTYYGIVCLEKIGRLSRTVK